MINFLLLLKNKAQTKRGHPALLLQPFYQQWVCYCERLPILTKLEKNTVLLGRIFSRLDGKIARLLSVFWWLWALRHITTQARPSSGLRGPEQLLLMWLHSCWHSLLPGKPSGRGGGKPCDLNLAQDESKAG